jgi:enoyl-[acyl-carrier protein] reductase I
MEQTLKGKKYLIMGVTNERSIAWSVATELHERGAQLAFTYPNEAIEKRCRPLAESLGGACLPCDVQSDKDLDNLFQEVKTRWETMDGVVHSIAFANGEDLEKPFSQTGREGFRLALDVSAYSLVGVADRAAKLMTSGGSVITMTYLGSERVVPNYNVMGVAKAALEASVRYLAADLGPKGIRVNAISAGPIKTLAAMGIPKFRDMLAQVAERAPLRRNVSQEDVGKLAQFLLSPDSTAITGETIFVDCGYNILGM